MNVVLCREFANHFRVTHTVCSASKITDIIVHTGRCLIRTCGMRYWEDDDPRWWAIQVSRVNEILGLGLFAPRSVFNAHLLQIHGLNPTRAVTEILETFEFTAILIFYLT